MYSKQNIGAQGEKIAAEYLVKKGYKILETNVKLSYKELDIVALKNKTLHFIEVRSRASSSFGSPEESFSPQKARNLKIAISMFLNLRKNKYAYHDYQLDFMAVVIGQPDNLIKITHYENIG
jgi:putative endonuclease